MHKEMTMKNKHEELVPMMIDDLLIVELDDRLEMALAAVDATNIGSNSDKCTQNGYCKPTT
jgi:hypothetical protein